MTNINPQLASASVYRLLNNKDCDIQSVICSFVLINFIEWRKQSFSAPEMSDLLKEKSLFQIPTAVVREALLAKGRSYFVYDKRSKTFSKNHDCPIETINELTDLVEKTRIENDRLIDCIAKFISEKTGKDVTETEYYGISNGVSDYLIGKENNEYSQLISEFLIKETPDSPASRQLQSIKEGNILLEGLSQNITSATIQDNYNVPLTLYLETEILFHICGLNGEEYKRIGEDFINTVQEINSKSSNKKPIVKLSYFSETYDELMAYFEAARNVVRNKNISPQSGTAMRHIVSQCDDPSLVDALREATIKQLTSLGITIDSDTNYKPHKELNRLLNLEGQDEIERFQNEFEEKWTEKDIENSLKLINYINLKRGDLRRDLGYLKIRHLLITGKGVTFAIDRIQSRDSNLRPKNSAHFVTSIERITNYLWMSLSKNLISDSSLPSSMSVMVHAQTFIARKLEGKLQCFYSQLKKELDTGKFDEETTSGIAKRLYTLSHNPENITSDTIESVSRVLSLESINEFNEMLKKDHKDKKDLERKVVDLEQAKKQTEHQVLKASEQNERLKAEKDQLQRLVNEAGENQRKKNKEIEEYQTEIQKYKDLERARELKRKRLIRYLLIIGVVLMVILLGLAIYWIYNQVKEKDGFSWSGNIWNIVIGVLSSIIAMIFIKILGKTTAKIQQLNQEVT